MGLRGVGGRDRGNWSVNCTFLFKRVFDDILSPVGNRIIDK
jgi:hypothetical protein